MNFQDYARQFWHWMRGRDLDQQRQAWTESRDRHQHEDLTRANGAMRQYRDPDVQLHRSDAVEDALAQRQWSQVVQRPGSGSGASFAARLAALQQQLANEMQAQQNQHSQEHQARDRGYGR